MKQQRGVGQAGQGLVEYGLLVLLISVVVLGAFLFMGGQFAGIYSSIADAV
jgi:Flp pilus assembly pilin Flp